MSAKKGKDHFVAKYKEGEVSPDLFEVAGIKTSDISFWSQSGDEGERWSVLSSNPDDFWKSPNKDHSSLQLQFKGFNVTIDTIAIGSKKDMPLVEAAICGFNGNNWEYIAHIHTELFKSKSATFIFPIDKEFHHQKYRAIAVMSLSGRFSLSNLKFYGELHKDGVTVDKSHFQHDMKFTPAKMPPKLLGVYDKAHPDHDLFKSAQKIYGPIVKFSFVDIWTNDEKGYDRFAILNSSDKVWKGTSMTLYFNDYGIKLSKYALTMAKPFLKKWYIVGVPKCPDNSKEFDVISEGSTQNTTLKDGTTLLINVEPPFCKRPYKILSICNPDDDTFALQEVRLFGKGKLDQTKINEKIIARGYSERQIKDQLQKQNSGNKGKHDESPKSKDKPSGSPKSDNKKSEPSSKDKAVSKYEDGKANPDLFEKAGINSGDIAFWSESGDEGERWSVLNKDPNDFWTSSKGDFASLQLQFKGFFIKVEKIGIGSKKELPLVDCAICGYNGTNWEIISHVKTDAFKSKTATFIFPVDSEHKNTKYRAIAIMSLDGRFTLTNLSFYGELDRDGVTVDKSVFQSEMKFAPPKMPATISAPYDKNHPSNDLFEISKKTYGPRVFKHFVDLFTKDKKGCVRSSILYNNDKVWISDNVPTMTFLFIDYEVQLTNFALTFAKPFVKSWYLVGISEYSKRSDNFDVIFAGTTGNTEIKEDTTLICKIDEPFNTKKYKVIVFVNDTDTFAIKQIKFYGKAHHNTSAVNKDILLTCISKSQVEKRLKTQK